MSLDEALLEAYRTWAVTGRPSVPDFKIEDQPRDALDQRLAALDAVSRQCVISKIQADWLRQVLV